jgi:hypothetical protein
MCFTKTNTTIVFLTSLLGGLYFLACTVVGVSFCLLLFLVPSRGAMRAKCTLAPMERVSVFHQFEGPSFHPTSQRSTAYHQTNDQKHDGGVSFCVGCLFLCVFSFRINALSKGAFSEQGCQFSNVQGCILPDSRASDSVSMNDFDYISSLSPDLFC